MVNAKAVACVTPYVVDMNTVMINKRNTVKVNVSAMDATRATSKLRKNCPDEAPFPLPVMP